MIFLFQNYFLSLWCVLISNNDVDNTTNKAETKIRGRHSGESPSALLRHRLGLVRSDRPSLFNSNSYFMRTNKSKKTGSEIPVNEIRKLHACNRQNVIQNLFSRPINQLVSDYLVEMNAKNQAYYFILDQGLNEAFRKYCEKQRRA